MPGRVLRADDALVDVARVPQRPLEAVPAVGRVLRGGADVDGRVEPRALEVRAHERVDVAAAELPARLDPQGHARRQVDASGVIEMLRGVEGRRRAAEDVPDPRLAEARAGERHGVHGVGEARERRVRVRRVEAPGDEEVHEVRRRAADRRVVAGQPPRDARLVRVREDRAVGHAQRDVEDAVRVEVAAARQLHVPDLVAVRDAEALEVARVAVGLAERHHRLDGFPRGPRALQRDPDQRPVVQQRAVRARLAHVRQQGQPAVRRLADDDAGLVRVADDVQRRLGLRDHAQERAAVPAVDVARRPGRVAPAGPVAHGADERRVVGVVAHVGAPVGGGALRDQNVRAGAGAGGEAQREGEEAGHFRVSKLWAGLPTFVTFEHCREGQLCHKKFLAKLFELC